MQIPDKVLFQTIKRKVWTQTNRMLAKIKALLSCNNLVKKDKLPSHLNSKIQISVNKGLVKE
jgi:hypothetical protein